jgi:hypothetical protein
LSERSTVASIFVDLNHVLEETGKQVSRSIIQTLVCFLASNHSWHLKGGFGAKLYFYFLLVFVFKQKI